MKNLSLALLHFVLQSLSFCPFYVTTFYVCLLEQLCCDIDNCVATLFLCSFFKIVSRPSFYVATKFLLFLVTTMFFVLSAFLPWPEKSVAIESCLYLT